MPGNSSVQVDDPTIVQLFYHALRVQYIWVLALTIVAAVVIVLVRRHSPTAGAAEPAARTYLRWIFGLFWLIDGVLQHQGGMPLGLANQVVAPVGPGTPFWLHSLVVDGVTLWNRFPIALAAATMWIQLGIGFLLISSRGTWSRVAAGVSVGWGLLVWVVGNAMGGIFSTSSSFLFGWPGAVLFYVIAGVWLALPPGVFPERFSRLTLRFVSGLLVLAALWQLYPDHGFWHGGPVNPVRQMAQTMTSAAQPSWLASWVNSIGRFGAFVGGGLNLMVIIWLGICAYGLWRASTRTIRWPIIVLIGGCVVIWIVVQDAAVFGGLSTDVNSMLPLSALVWCAAPARRHARPITLPLPELSQRTFAIVGGALGVAMVVIAIVPMLRSTVSAGAETTAYLAQNTSVSAVAIPAPSFTLVDQHGDTVTFPVSNGKYTVLTFLDPRCWTDCPLLAHQLRDLDATLTASERSHLQLIALAANPYHEQVSDLQAFMKRNYLTGLTNFTYVTGPRAVMRRNWANYGVEVTMAPTAKMSIHSDVMFVIDPAGEIRVIVPERPGQRRRDDPVVGRPVARLPPRGGLQVTLRHRVTVTAAGAAACRRDGRARGTRSSHVAPARRPVEPPREGGMRARRAPARRACATCRRRRRREWAIRRRTPTTGCCRRGRGGVRRGTPRRRSPRPRRARRGAGVLVESRPPQGRA